MEQAATIFQIKTWDIQELNYCPTKKRLTPAVNRHHQMLRAKCEKTNKYIIKQSGKGLRHCRIEFFSFAIKLAFPQLKKSQVFGLVEFAIMEALASFESTLTYVFHWRE